MRYRTDGDWKEGSDVFYLIGSGDEKGVMEYILSHPDSLNESDADGRT